MAADKILIIDSDEEDRNFVIKFLELWGYEIRNAPSGEEGLSLFQEDPPDLVVLSLFLESGMAGMDVLTTIKEDPEHADLPVLVLCKDISDEMRIVVLSNGADEFLKKPIETADFAMRVQKSLELYHYKENSKELNEKLQKEKKRLLRYFSHDLVDQILSEDMYGELGGTIVEASIMFFDVRRSTTIAERIGPKAYADLISSLFSDLMDIVFKNKGSVNELLGDGMLATFGCPVPTDEDAWHSVKCALDIRDYMQEYNGNPPESLGHTLGYGMGIATGRIFAGNIGSVRRMKYAVMGDPVNTAARLEGVTKELKCDIVIDTATRNIAGERIVARKSNIDTIRGREGQIGIYSLEGLSIYYAHQRAD